MPHFFVFAVAISRVTQLQSLHDLGQPNLAGFDQQVNVVAHQHVGIHFEAVTLAVLLEPFQIVSPVRVAAEYRLALIAAANHMVKRSRIFHSRFSRHWYFSMSVRPLISQYESLTPNL